MNEGTKTLIFVGVAAVAGGLAWFARPEAILDQKDLGDQLLGEQVFPKFEDPNTASSFEIVSYNEELGTLRRFELARDKATKTWRLPSHDDYPADATEQVRDATTPLVGLTILEVKSFDKADHTLFGVINPDDEELSVSEEGVGMLVEAKDDESQVLASLVIGKEVEQATGQRYVRVPTQDAVYVVELDTTPFTTNFDSWIKTDLLGVRSFDISEIQLRDYVVLPSANGSYGMQRNFDADVSFDAENSAWALGKLVTYETGKAAEAALAADEELNKKTLDDLRTAIQDLKIVGVRRKPKGLAADLKADKSLMENSDSLKSLYSQGFFPQETATGVEIYATGGETMVTSKDGVKYLLRFGDSETGDTNSSTGESQAQRFLLATAKLDESAFPIPELEPVPETVEEMLKMEQAAKEAAQPPVALPEAPMPEAVTEPTPPAEEATDKEMPANEDAGEEKVEATADETSKEGTATEKTEKSETSEAPANSEEPKSEKTANEEPKSEKPAEEKPAEGKPTVEEPGKTEEPPKSEGGSSDQASVANSQVRFVSAELQQEGEAGATQETTEADESAEPASNEAAPQESEEELKERLQVVRERIAKENQRKLDERNEAIDEARKKVQELNARFADWYYLVSDDVYKKLTVSRDQLIQKKGANAAAPTQPGVPGLPPGMNLPQMPQFNAPPRP